MKSEEFEPPMVEYGEIVHFHPAADVTSEPCMARVVKVCGRGIDLDVFSSNTVGHERHYAIPHFRDPRLIEHPARRADGCWVEHPDRVRRDKLEKRVGALEAKIEDLLTTPAKK